MTCTGLEYSDLGSLVHADMEIIQAAATCFQQKVEEIEVCCVRSTEGKGKTRAVRTRASHL